MTEARADQRRLPEQEDVTGGQNLSAAVLERWTLFGAHWQLIEISQTQATVELCACTGEVVQRLQTRDPEMIQYLCSPRAKSESTNR